MKQSNVIPLEERRNRLRKELESHDGAAESAEDSPDSTRKPTQAEFNEAFYETPEPILRAIDSALDELDRLRAENLELRRKLAHAANLCRALQDFLAHSSEIHSSPVGRSRVDPAVGGREETVDGASAVPSMTHLADGPLGESSDDSASDQARNESATGENKSGLPGGRPARDLSVPSSDRVAPGATRLRGARELQDVPPASMSKETNQSESKTELTVRPAFPQEEFEVALRSFVERSWPDSTWVKVLEDVARSTFYEDYDPRVTWVGLPSADLRRAISFATEQLEALGFPRC